ncbi:BTB/POZ domain-containing protein 2-like [Chrysoperla carnea]|uniref:BTB/POZ domain-containing protein 2-like n=1 Tax=Chrysoperla carnea TaxID=189513 RepID=UPI001D09972F|nr:BTB/POZ domain-containing protein 2-like [Chrysoperla carnea]
MDVDLINKSNKSVIEKWQPTKETIRKRFSFLFNNEKFSDVYFIVGKEKQHRIPAHKLVLVAASDVFETMFFGSLATKSNEIELPDVEPLAFLAFLEFIYSDDAKIDQNIVMPIIYIAKKYNVPALNKYCENYLKKNIDSHHAVLLLMQARFLDEPELADMCLEYIDRNATSAFFAVDDFIDLDLDTLIEILKRDTLHIEESKLYEAVLAWTKAECARKQLPLSPDNQRLILGSAFKLIRFPLMTLEEFHSGPVQSELLTHHEIGELMSYFTTYPKPSIEFSDVPRHCENLYGKELAVSRFRHANQVIWDYDKRTTEGDSIRFMVNRRIFVVGFGLYGAVSSPAQDNKFDVDIQILRTETNEVCGSNATSFRPNGSCRTYDVRFKEPIEILSNTNYTASVVIKRPNTYAWCGHKGESEVTFDFNGESITFQFASTGTGVTDVDKGQIPVFMFYT